jgi:LuxR family maltose regulon positive regulatory protein
MMEIPDATLPLIKTKLAPPRIGSAPVERRELLERLNRQRSCKLQLLVGPAGSGKTSVLVQWRKQLLDAGAHVAWYSAGPDDDESRVASYLVESLRQSGMSLGLEGLQLFLRSGGAAWERLLASLVNDCADATHETYLVIDNFQHLSSFQLLQLLNRWIALAPPTLHFVLATRVSPPLDLARLRAEGQLLELEFNLLRFDADETRRFVESQGLPTPDPAQLESLHRMTDGWPAGLQLLTFSMRNDGRGSQVLERPEAWSMKQVRALDDYLEQTVIGLLHAAELDFLMRIAVCRRFNRQLCEAVTGNADAGAYLRKFESENLFLLPIDTEDIEPWYRFHPLIGNFMAKRLHRFGSGGVQKLNRHAALWFAEHQLHTEAVRHAVCSDDAELLVDLIDQRARRLVDSGQYFEYLRWCEQAAPALLAQRLNASLCLALAQLSCGRMRDFEQTMSGIERHPQAAQANVQIELHLLKAYHALRIDDPLAQRQAVAMVERHPPPGDSIAGLMLTSLRCHELAYAGRFEAVREAAWLRFRGGSVRRQVVQLVDYWVGFSHLLEGHPQRAAEQLKNVITAGRQSADVKAAASGVVYGYLMEALYQADRIDEARLLLEQQFQLVEAIGLPDSLMYAYRVRARIERLDGDHASAMKTLQNLEEHAQRMGIVRLVAWSLHDQIRLAVDMDEDTRADELIRRLKFTARPWMQERGNVRSEIPLATALALAEHAVWSSAPQDTTSALLQSAADIARDSGRRIAELHIGLVQVCFLQQIGQQKLAAERLRDSLRLVMRLGLRRLPADLPLALRRSLQALAPMIDDAEVSKFLRSLDAAAPAPAEADAIPPIVAAAGSTSQPAPRDAPLTVREREIIDLLSQALSIKSIARELNVSPGTVKWHLRNVYGKLGAFSKEDAVAKMRERRKASASG